MTGAEGFTVSEQIDDIDIEDVEVFDDLHAEVEAVDADEEFWGIIENAGVFQRGKQSDDLLKLSLVRKVSPDGWYQESKNRWVPTIPNSFGLPAGETCPGKTEFCKSCYAANSSQAQGVQDMLNHNYEFLKACETIEEMEVFLTEMVARYDAFADKKGVDPKDKFFRHHWSGDFYSQDYAEAWARTMQRFPHIQFWGYTRSFGEPVDVVPILTRVPNMTLYLSVDEGNLEAANKYPDLPRAYCAEDYRRAELLNNTNRKARVCPENKGRLKLMEDGRGACVQCRWCTDGRTDIIFSTSHKYDSAPQLGFAMDVEERPIEVPVKLQPKRSIIAGPKPSQLPGLEDKQ